MIATWVSDLFEPANLSPGRLEQALQQWAPRALAWCDAARSGPTRTSLREQLAAAIVPALAVGLPECIARRWLPLQNPAAQPATPLLVSFELRPQLDLMVQGLPALTLELLATVQLTQAYAQWSGSPAGQLQLSSDRAWEARLALHIADAGTHHGSQAFYERRSSIFLPPGPWPC